MARRLRRNAVPKTGTTLDYSHTNDRRQLGLAEPGDYILPLYLIHHRHALLAVCTEAPPATGVLGWAMEWNRIGRSHVYL